MIKAHKGLPPEGWQSITGRPGFIEKTAQEASAQTILEKMRGPKGDKGDPGKDGRPGRDGDDGGDGATIESVDQVSDNKAIVKLSDGRSYQITLPAGPEGKPGKDATGNSIKAIKSHGQDMHFVMADGEVHKVKLPSQGTPFGGGGGGAEVKIEPGGGLVQKEDGALAVGFTWIYLAAHWDVPPEQIGTSSAPVAGDVYQYTLEGVTRYRLVPATYSATNDIFYESFTDGECAGVVAVRSIS